MFAQEFECPSCGGPIKRSKPGSKTLACPFCGQTSHLNADSLEAVGNKHLLIDYGSSLSLGQQAQLDSRDLLILGRLRFEYDDGFWDEWYVTFLDDGSEAWIQEDDGSFVLFKQEKEVSRGLDYASIKVGTFDTLGGNWDKVFVTEKHRARIQGGEGELPFRIVPGEQVDFVDAIWQGRILSVELMPDENVLFVGVPFNLQALALSAP